MDTAAYRLSTVYLYFKYCNLSCRHCWINPPFSEEITVNDDEASLDEIICALEECRSLGMKSIKLTGGEPFLRKDIFGLLDYLNKNNLRITVETNATLIRQEEARALKAANVWHVAVSLDGPDAVTHEALRKTAGSFNDTIQGIKALKETGLNLQVITCLWKGNRDKIQATARLAKELGANSLKINPIHRISRAQGMDEGAETLDVKEVLEYYNELDQMLDEEPLIKVIFDLPPAFRIIKNQQLEQLCACNLLHILGILGDGRVSLCGIGSSSETLVLGEIGKNRIKDIWENHPTLRELRDNVPQNLTGVCAKCMLKYYCLGKCRAEAYYTQGSLLAPLSFCQAAYEQGLFPQSRLIA